MIVLAIVIFIAFLLSVCVITSRGREFGKFLCSSQASVHCSQLPKAAIVMSVRGADPSLRACVSSLLQQDYPSYWLEIVVDSEDDPAWELINQTIRDSEAINVSVVTLKERYPTCSLKCSALLQGVKAIDPSYEVIAIVDSDAIAYPTWLRELVEPIARNPQIGVTSGTRWYMPDDSNLGSLVRYLWNISGAVSMRKYECPWGGSMAIRRSVFHEGNLIEIWKQVLSDDNTAASAARDMGLTIYFVPTAILINRERCNLAGFWRFSNRQFLWTRLYGSFWKEISRQIVFRLTLLALASVMIPLSWFMGNGAALTWVLWGVGMYALALLSMVALLEWNTRKILAQRGEEGYILSPLKIVQIALSLPIAHMLGIGSLLISMTMRQVEWRGANYEIRESYDVRLTNYRSFESQNSPVEAEASIL